MLQPLPVDRAPVLPVAHRGLWPSRRGGDGLRGRRGRVRRGPVAGPGRPPTPVSILPIRGRSLPPSSRALTSTSIPRGGPVRTARPGERPGPRLRTGPLPPTRRVLVRPRRPRRRRRRRRVAIFSPVPASRLGHRQLQLPPRRGAGPALGDLDIDCFADGLDRSAGQSRGAGRPRDLRRPLVSADGGGDGRLRRGRLRARQQRVPHGGVVVAAPAERDRAGSRGAAERAVPFRRRLEIGSARRYRRHAYGGSTARSCPKGWPRPVR